MGNKIVKIKPTHRTKFFDGISMRSRPKVALPSAQVGKKPVLSPKVTVFRRVIAMRSHFSAVLTTVLLFVGFLAGFWFTWQTKEIGAEGQVLGATTVNEEVMTAGIQTETVASSSVAQISDDRYFKMTIDQIEGYLNEVVKTPQMQEAERLELRKKKLKAYLAEKGSPFVEISDSIAELPHWKMILAISNSESTMGKRCYNNNCSGIGVAPGHPLWREYPSHKEWAKDLNKLLEKRYKNWTLERMNGVYNQPGSRNWVLASKQVLEELQERAIE